MVADSSSGIWEDGLEGLGRRVGPWVGPVTSVTPTRLVSGAFPSCFLGLDYRGLVLGHSLRSRLTPCVRGVGTMTSVEREAYRQKVDPVGCRRRDVRLCPSYSPTLPLLLLSLSSPLLHTSLVLSPTHSFLPSSPSFCATPILLSFFPPPCSSLDRGTGGGENWGSEEWVVIVGRWTWGWFRRGSRRNGPESPQLSLELRETPSASPRSSSGTGGVRSTSVRVLHKGT